MNLSISNGNAVNRKSKGLKAVYIAAACAAALAAGAVVTNVSGQHHSTLGTDIISSTAAAAMAIQPAQSPSFVYYLTGSPQDAAAVSSLLSSEGAAFGTVQNTAVLVDGPETRRLVSAASQELMRFGIGVRVVEPAASANAPIAHDETVSQVDATIMAGVLSSERASWIFPAD